MTIAQIIEKHELEGFESHFNAIDDQVARETDCPNDARHGKLSYAGFKRTAGLGVVERRAICYCIQCGYSEDF